MAKKQIKNQKLNQEMTFYVWRTKNHLQPRGNQKLSMRNRQGPLTGIKKIIAKNYEWLMKVAIILKSVQLISGHQILFCV